MSVKLKESVLFKDVNESSIYVVDCLAQNEIFYKFEGPAKFFIENLKDGKTEAEIVLMTVEVFEGCEKSQVETDYKDFIEVITKYKLID